MSNLSPRQLAIGSASLLGLLAAVATLLLTDSWMAAAVVAGITLVLGYLVNYLMLRHFLGKQIRPLYDIINKHKEPQQAKEEGEHMEDESLQTVRQHVVEWAQEQQNEIHNLRQLATFRKEFLGNVSHELKTPLFNIQGYLHTLLDGGLEDPNINRRFLEKATENAERMEQMVKELDIITQLERGILELDPVNFDLMALVQSVFDSLEIKAQRHDITLTFKAGMGSGFMVYADQEKIRHVLVNLIENSIKYGKEDGITTLGFYDNEDTILTEITDNGIGIGKEHLPRLFERFYRVEKSRSRTAGGSGLGLSIVKHIIEAHHQSIHVRSKPSVGTTFGFTLSKGKKAKKKKGEQKQDRK